MTMATGSRAGIQYLHSFGGSPHSHLPICFAFGAKVSTVAIEPGENIGVAVAVRCQAYVVSLPPASSV
jgi:hypothetical protein